MKDRARTVVIGAGIVGASAAYHLAELGERDLLVLDQGQTVGPGIRSGPLSVPLSIVLVALTLR